MKVQIEISEPLSRKLKEIAKKLNLDVSTLLQQELANIEVWLERANL